MTSSNVNDYVSQKSNYSTVSGQPGGAKGKVGLPKKNIQLSETSS